MLTRPPKSPAARRQIGLPQVLTDTLAAHLAANPAVEGYVFTSPRGHLLRRTAFRRRFFLPAVGESVGEPMRFHDLCHTHVALLIARGEHPKLIETRLGHSSIQITLDLYGHLFEGLDEEAAERLDATLTAPLPEHSRNKGPATILDFPTANDETLSW